jgi:hypothetical protein
MLESYYKVLALRIMETEKSHTMICYLQAGVKGKPVTM